MRTHRLPNVMRRRGNVLPDHLYACHMLLSSRWHLPRHPRLNLPGTTTRPFAITSKLLTTSCISSVPAPHLRKASNSGRVVRPKLLKGPKRLKGSLMYRRATIKQGVYQLDSRL